MASPARELRVTDTPLRTIVFSSYYDATTAAKEQDYGNFVAVTQEDFYFTSALRALALSRLRREASNNPYLAGLVEKFPEAVGYCSLRSRTGSRDYNVKKDRWWRRIAKKLTSSGDSLRVVEAILKMEMLLAGELFFVKRLGGKLQVIPSEFCGSAGPVEATRADGSREVNGIVYNAAGDRTHYRFGKVKPGGTLGYGAGESELIPAEFVIHVFHKKRVHQGRGLPWLLASLRTARDLYEITRSKTKQIKDANSISGFLEKANAAETVKGFTAPEVDASGAPIPEKVTDAADPVKKDKSIIELSPGTFIALEPGEKVHSLMSTYNAADYKELIMLMLHAMSSPVGLPVELWFSGLGDVNYSGYKGLGVQWNGRRQDVIEFLTSAFYEPFHAWRVEQAELLGDLPPNPDPEEENYEFVFRRTPILDDEKEGKSNKIKLESGETDLEEIWAEKGYTSEEVFARRRQTWIKMRIAAGELSESDDLTKVIVPIGYLHRNELPGETTVPHIPDGTGAPDDAEAAAADAKSAAEDSGQSATDAKTAADEARQALATIRTLLAALKPAA